MSEMPLHGIAIYNPDLWSKEELKRHFIARNHTLEKIIKDIRRERAGTSPQHRLILGHRGMGKTTLLRRISYAVEDDAELSQEWLALTFPEEQYNIARPADLWLNCLDALSDHLERAGENKEANAIDVAVENIARTDTKKAQTLLLDTAKRLNKRLILLIDNIDLVFDRLKEYQWELREVLQSEPSLMIIGASSRAVEASYKYDAAFYDFFRVDELKALTEEEMCDTLLNLAEINQAEQVTKLIKEDPARIQTLHTLTGGNPRTAVMLYGVLAHGFKGDVRSDLEGLLDKVTPLYKARFEELPPQAQQVVDALAIHWDPATARTLAEKLAWDVNTVSAQLNRLKTLSIVEKVNLYGGKRAGFQISERFFNIWYLMRASRRLRRKLMWLVQFLKMFFNGKELQEKAIELSPPEPWHKYQLMLLLKSNYSWPTIQIDLPVLFDIEKHENDEWYLEELILFLAIIIENGDGANALQMLDSSNSLQQLRPLREALAAAVEGTAEYLNNVAPEIRQPALGIFDKIFLKKS